MELRILKDKVELLEDQKLQYEKKLKATKVKESSESYSAFLSSTKSNGVIMSTHPHQYTPVLTEFFYVKIGVIMTHLHHCGGS